MKPSPLTVGPDYNNQWTLNPQTFAGHNVTLKRLVMEAYDLQSPQVAGPKWIDESEFELEAKSASPASRQQFRAMLRALLDERFHLKTHREQKDTRVMELTGAAKIQPVALEAASAQYSGGRFRGTMVQLAELVSAQLSIIPVEDPSTPAVASRTPTPVLDRTGLAGVYEFPVDRSTGWPRILQNLGLKLETRKTPLEVLVIDSADRVPVAN